MYLIFSPHRTPLKGIFLINKHKTMGKNNGKKKPTAPEIVRLESNWKSQQTRLSKKAKF